MATSQHRCVFVGNIPYDATEEQLIQICEEVGPVVSFRLVLDRETRKPKGYGFCEYKDEETALSARRNLQGYEINGRQLRVDFAENDKGSDRNREQGRGGPGLASTTDAQKPSGSGVAVHADPSLHQSIGIQLALTAASVMAGTLGDRQITIGQSNQMGFQSQSSLGNDPLTHYLAKMSRSQLYEVMSELKTMAKQNKALARQLLLSSPTLLKAFFQLQMPNIRQSSSSIQQSSIQEDNQLTHPSQISQTLPLQSASSAQLGLLPRIPEGQLVPPSGSPIKALIGQSSSSLPLQRQSLMQPMLSQYSQHAQTQIITGVQSAPSISPQQPLTGSAVRPQSTPSVVVPKGSQKQQVQQPLLQHKARVGALTVVNNSQMSLSNSIPRPLPAQTNFQPGPSSSSIFLDGVETASREGSSNAQLGQDTSWGRIDILDPTTRPSKLMRLDDGNNGSSIMGSNANASESVQGFRTSSLSANLKGPIDGAQQSEQQAPQLVLLPGVESALLQQVMSLTSEQLNSLPPEQRQQVLRLQQMLR
ncbi:cleavage stimulating factor 64-like isoform X2 [Aristolochia californica]|uniref:cleavage stimulating factor 64-like isoform X2 n=1 Tax=Aristolochia californica TaxID=171875 RepID=UPI0035D6F794